MGGEPMLEACFGMEIVSRLRSQLGSWVQAESILAEERSLESIPELEEVPGLIVTNSNQN